MKILQAVLLVMVMLMTLALFAGCAVLKFLFTADHPAYVIANVYVATLNEEPPYDLVCSGRNRLVGKA